MSTDNSNSLNLAKIIAELAIDKKAERVISIDLKNLTSITDHFLICSADTDIQTKAIADNIRKSIPPGISKTIIPSQLGSP